MKMAALQLRILLVLSVWMLADHAVSVYPSELEEEEKVTFLPGYDGPLPFELFTGYITVNETTQDHMFYYFVKSERNAAEDPLVLWITGGPGCSGFSGLVFEIGPLRFKVEKYNGSLPTLVNNPYSFTKVASIIFIDSPIGTGFSYSITEEGYQNGGDYRTVEEAYTFLTKWLSIHTEFSSNPLYIGGDSYGGMIVSLLTPRIVEGIEEGNKLLSNLKGYFMGNPIVDTRFNVSEVEFAHQLGFIPHDLHEATKKSCNGQYYHPTNEECAKNLEIVEALYADINPAHVLEYYCRFLWSSIPGRGMRSMWRALSEHQNYLSSVPIPPLECREYGYFLCFIWGNDVRVQHALHVRQGTVAQWKRCNSTLKDNYKMFEVEDTIEYHRNLTTEGYRLLVYSGDHDLGVPHIGTETWIASLNYSVVEKWHPWFVGSQVGGYTRKYAHDLTYATVKGGGHTAPEYRPKECYAMIQRWLSKQPL